MVVNFNEQVYETVPYTGTDLVINTGSYLVIFCLAVVMVFGLIGLMFVYSYMSELKYLIQRKYVEESYLNGIKRLQRKFGTIYGALQEKRDDP